MCNFVWKGGNQDITLPLLVTGEAESGYTYNIMFTHFLGIPKKTEPSEFRAWRNILGDYVVFSKFIPVPESSDA